MIRHVSEVEMMINPINEKQHQLDNTMDLQNSAYSLDRQLFDRRKEFELDIETKFTSAKKILKSIDKNYSLIFQKSSDVAWIKTLEKQTFFNSSLFYFIASTDGNEDSIGHSQLVSRFTLMLTKALGVDDSDFMIRMENGASLHDIGKICIPEEILRKPSSLTAEERIIVQDHPLLGYELIKEYDYLKNAVKIVLYHHENYDGTGYPFNLKGEDIPLEARIFSLVDTLDAITSDRPYRKAQGFSAAIEEIEKGKGTQFDPTVVDAFLSIPSVKWEQVKTETESALRISTIH
jgi:HD-GYP domain-containing protein (c-di-GMP phosphodiesterase class II)